MGSPIHVPLPPVSDRAVTALADYAQGEIVEVRSLPMGLPGSPSLGENSRFLKRFLRTIRRQAQAIEISAYPALHGSVVLSQTCDIVQADRLTVQLAPLVSLGEADASAARIYRRPRYIPLPNADEGLFIDLQNIATVHKNYLVDIAHRPGVNNAREGRKFAQAIGRRFTRFAFPDELHPWLRPLEGILEKKADKAASPEGRALTSVIEIRIEAKGKWEDPPPYFLTVIVIVEQGVLPYAEDDEVPEQPGSIAAWLRDSNGDLRRGPAEIADKLNKSTLASERYYLWLALGEAWAAQCRPAASEQESSVLEAVDSVDGEVVSADDLTMDRWWGSEALDLDHLSSPRPK